MSEAGPVALVTGGASGIGWAIARRLASAGATVEIADLDGDRARSRAAELGLHHGHQAVDIGDPAAAAAMVRGCRDRFGRIDILVNNVGRTNNSGLNLAEQPRASFDEIVGINTEGALAAAREAAALMAETGGGSIVNIASGAAFRALPFRSAYSPSKAALLSMSRRLALTWAHRNVRVNVVAPGFVHTELLQELISSGRLDPSHAIARIPLGRMGKPEEIAAAVAFFASKAANTITGVALNVDGGSSTFGGSGAASRQIGSAPTAPPSGQHVTVVVGAANRLGTAIASEMSEGGNQVVLIDTDKTPLEGVCAAVGKDCAAFVDAGEEESLASVFRDIKARFKRIDGVVNLRPDGARPEGDAKPIRARLGRVHRVVRAAGPTLLDQGYGAFVNLTYGLTSAASGPHADEAAAVEAGVEMLSRTLACEWGGSGVRANTLALEDCSIEMPGARAPGGCARLPRTAEAADIAQAVAFLLSDDAGFVNAAMLSINCDREELLAGSGKAISR